MAYDTAMHMGFFRTGFLVAVGAGIIASTLLCVAQAEPGEFLANWPKDTQPALRQAIRKGDSKAVSQLVLPNNKPASFIAREDLPDAYYWLGVSHEQNKQWANAAQWYDKAATLDHPEAQYRLALLSLQGKLKDPTVATRGQELLLQAAKHNVRDAQLQLAMAYEQGRWGFAKDLNQAVNWYRKAALNELPLAQYALGFLYERGRGVTGDLPLAAHWYQRAAENGLTVAQYRLGLMYLDGKGLGKDAAKARNWLAKAGDKGHLNAQLQLGLMYEDGLLGNSDWDGNYQEALRWYKKAAAQGNSDGQMAVGTFYMMGWGVDQNFVEAYRWLQPSAKQGNEAAITWLKHLQGQMSKEELAKATQQLSGPRPAKAPKPSVSTAATLKSSPVAKEATVANGPKTTIIKPLASQPKNEGWWFGWGKPAANKSQSSLQASR
jgi:TPR repeat protein